jgi:hypothetical protein
VTRRRCFHFYAAAVLAYWMMIWPSALGADRTTFRNSVFKFRFVSIGVAAEEDLARS